MRAESLERASGFYSTDAESEQDALVREDTRWSGVRTEVDRYAVPIIVAAQWLPLEPVQNEHSFWKTRFVENPHGPVTNIVEVCEWL